MQLNTHHLTAECLAAFPRNGHSLSVPKDHTAVISLMVTLTACQGPPATSQAQALTPTDTPTPASALTLAVATPESARTISEKTHESVFKTPFIFMGRFPRDPVPRPVRGQSKPQKWR